MPFALRGLPDDVLLLLLARFCRSVTLIRVGAVDCRFRALALAAVRLALERHERAVHDRPLPSEPTLHRLLRLDEALGVHPGELRRGRDCEDPAFSTRPHTKTLGRRRVCADERQSEWCRSAIDKLNAFRRFECRSRGAAAPEELSAVISAAIRHAQADRCILVWRSHVDRAIAGEPPVVSVRLGDEEEEGPIDGIDGTGSAAGSPSSGPETVRLYGW